jgi:hypothetical protein
MYNNIQLGDLYCNATGEFWQVVGAKLDDGWLVIEALSWPQHVKVARQVEYLLIDKEDNLYNHISEEMIS